MSYTDDNLEKAFIGEAQANRKYLAYAQKAESDGYKQIAKLFRAAAEAETVHALAHFAKMNAVGSTEENLKQAITGETYEAQEMYPSMISHAKQDGNTAAETGFRWANKVEEEHVALYKEALEKMKDLPAGDYYVCQVCGHTHFGQAPESCPICGAPKEKFKKVE